MNKLMNMMTPLTAETILLAACSIAPKVEAPIAAPTPTSDLTLLVKPLPTLAVEEQKQQRRVDILAMKDRTLADLYKLKPEARREIESAEGFAIFDVQGAFIVLLVAEHGAGVLFDNATGKPSYMTMNRLGSGPGLGYERFRSVIVFKNKALMDQFKITGADVEASGHLVLKGGTDGGVVAGTQVSFNPALSVYQITDFGLAAEASWGAVAFVPDSRLSQ